MDTLDKETRAACREIIADTVTRMDEVLTELRMDAIEFGMGEAERWDDPTGNAMTDLTEATHLIMQARDVLFRAYNRYPAPPIPTLDEIREQTRAHRKEIRNELIERGMVAQLQEFDARHGSD